MTAREEVGSLPSELIGGTRVVNASRNTLVELAHAAIGECLRPPFTVAFINPHSIEAAREHSAVHSALSAVDFPAPDGVLITLGSRVLGGQIRTRYSGIDLLRPMLEKPGLSHFFLGSTPDVLEPLAERVRSQLVADSRGAFRSPPTWPWTSEVDKALIREINDFRPDILWIGLSAPKQELWMMRHADALNVSVVAAIGYAFDTYSGAQPLAPRWIRDLGLEWLYRFCHNPSHTWRRVFVTAPRFAGRVLSRKLRGSRDVGIHTEMDATDSSDSDQRSGCSAAT